MLIKIDNSSKLGKQVGGFGIQILYPLAVRLVRPPQGEP